MSRTLACLLGVVFASFLYGCATPQPVLDLANRGVGATTLAEIELRRYLAHSQDELSVRLFLVRQLSAAELEEAYGDQFSTFVKHKAGDTAGEDVVLLIQTLGQEHRRLREQMEAAVAKLDEPAQKVLGDLPVPSADAFAAARKAFTMLAQELSPQEWLALTTLYAGTINETVKKIKDTQKANAAKAGDADSTKTDSKPGDAQ